MRIRLATLPLVLIFARQVFAQSASVSPSSLAAQVNLSPRLMAWFWEFVKEEITP